MEEETFFYLHYGLIVYIYINSRMVCIPEKVVVATILLMELPLLAELKLRVD